LDHSHTKRKASLSTDDGVCAPTKAKRSRSLAFPSKKKPRGQAENNAPKKGAPKKDAPKKDVPKKDAPVGMSKQAVWKRSVLEEMKDKNWVPDPKKWATYKAKLVNLDRHVEVPDNPRFARYVKHSSCGSWIIMSLPYDIERFKSHVKSCSFSTTSGGMKTIDSYCVHVRPINAQTLPPSVPSTSSPPSPTNLPCLGITEKDDPRIAQYMKRTPVNSAGGDNIQDIAKELFASDFKNLNQEKKDIVRQKQLQTHSWSNDHIRKSVHAIGKNACDGKARMAEDGSLMPCSQCLALLASKAFRNAISRKCCENENRGFTPHIFQSSDVGRIYSLGLYELLDGVCITSILIRCSTRN
jgi:hypothetical protein